MGQEPPPGSTDSEFQPPLRAQRPPFKPEEGAGGTADWIAVAVAVLVFCSLIGVLYLLLS
ncbi:hypothetical protein M0638_05720 [Roseomonas sp. NAR14]|uniref:Uncharacterized protein n=1 Tax=Roseomonas acroporae TaxID=2937791 RepID=A0A9X1Y655_9PROT|nr:hypothetical protein [Roseomonas acroporae]MCK8783878.1 hypothetical protein [Roseomonas acroporae]